MKLRNKKTGEAVYVDFQIPLCNNNEALGSYSVTSLNELNKSFEDYEPPEPLIKDEKIRKAVRAWAEACRLTHVTYKLASNEFYDADTRGKFAIKFTLIPIEVYLKDGESYTIAELCGEE